MNDQDISARLYQLLIEHFELDPGRVTPESRLSEDLELDSIDAVDLALAIEELTGRDASAQDFQKAETVADLEKIVRRLTRADE